MIRFLLDTDHVSLQKRGDPHVYRKLLETVAFFNAVPVVPFDLACERRFQELRVRKLQVGSQDLRIAATALVHGLTVVTRNYRDFAHVPGLRLDDWSVP